MFFTTWPKIKHYSLPQIYNRDTRPCTILVLAWGWSWGSLGFSRNQNNCGSSGAFAALVTCMYCEREDNHALKAARHTKIVSTFVWQKNLKTPKLSPGHGCLRHYMGWYRKSGYLVCISVFFAHFTHSKMQEYLSLASLKSHTAEQHRLYSVLLHAAIFRVFHKN